MNGSQPDGQGGFSLPCTTNTCVALVFGGHTCEIINNARILMLTFVLVIIDSRDLLAFPIDVNKPTGNCVSGMIGTVAQLSLGSNL